MILAKDAVVLSESKINEFIANQLAEIEKMILKTKVITQFLGNTIRI